MIFSLSGWIETTLYLNAVFEILNSMNNVCLWFLQSSWFVKLSEQLSAQLLLSGNILITKFEFHASNRCQSLFSMSHMSTAIYSVTDVQTSITVTCVTDVSYCLQCYRCTWFFYVQITGLGVGYSLFEYLLLEVRKYVCMYAAYVELISTLYFLLTLPKLPQPASLLGIHCLFSQIFWLTLN